MSRLNSNQQGLLAIESVVKSPTLTDKEKLDNICKAICMAWGDKEIKGYLPKYQKSFTPSVLTIPINYYEDDDGVKHIDSDLIRQTFKEQMSSLES